MHAIALVMAILRVKTSTMRNTTKHWLVSLNSNERQSKNKNRALHFTGSKTSRGQMEEMLNNQRHTKKTNKKVAKGSNELTYDGEIVKMEQHNWTLLIACKICKKMSRAWRNLYQIHFSWYGKWWTKIHHVTLQITLTELRFQFINVTHQIQFSK